MFLINCIRFIVVSANDSYSGHWEKYPHQPKIVRKAEKEWRVEDKAPKKMKLTGETEELMNQEDQILPFHLKSPYWGQSLQQCTDDHNATDKAPRDESESEHNASNLEGTIGEDQVTRLRIANATHHAQNNRILTENEYVGLALFYLEHDIVASQQHITDDRQDAVDQYVDKIWEECPDI